MIIQIKDGKYQSYEVDVKFETRELSESDLEEMPDGRNRKIITKVLKVVGYSYDTQAFTKEQQQEIEHHIKEHMMDIEDILN